MSVSAALIVRNEERNIARCLESIDGSVDEIVVVDTGSQDRTKEVASRFTRHVCDLPWPDHFAQARQFAFDSTTADWVFWLDADDIVLGADHIREETAAAPAAVDGFAWRYVYARDSHGNVIADLWRERCVRNDNRFHWEGRVHEVLVPSRPAVIRRSHRVTVLHCRDPERPVDPRRNLKLLEAEHRAQAPPEPRLLLYLGNEHADLGEVDLAIDFLRRYVGVAIWSDEKYLALLRLAALHRQKGLYNTARQLAMQASSVHPDWPLAYYSLAETCGFHEDWSGLVGWVELARRLPEPRTTCCLNRLDLSYRWIIGYATALFHLGRIDEALRWTERALEICPGEPSHLANRELFMGALAGIP